MIRVLMPLQASSPHSRPYSIFMQRSSMTVRPARPAMVAASGLRMPSWSHRTLAPIGAADAAIAGVSSGRRKTSTTSTGTGIDSRSG